MLNFKTICKSILFLWIIICKKKLIVIEFFFLIHLMFQHNCYPHCERSVISVTSIDTVIGITTWNHSAVLNNPKIHTKPKNIRINAIVLFCGDFLYRWVRRCDFTCQSVSILVTSRHTHTNRNSGVSIVRITGQCISPSRI